jgi:methyl acetate hydrolase
MGYTFNSPDLDRWTKETSHPSFLGPKAEIQSYELPLVFEPKTQWHYSVGIDWAGHLVHRLTSLSLEEYFKENIFKPCGMGSTSFYPTEGIRRKAMAVTYLDPAGAGIKSYPDNYGSLHYARPERPEEVGELAGGAGLFGTAKDYLGFLRGILASDPSRRGNSTDSEASKPLISGESFRELFHDSIPSTVPKTGLLSMMQRQTYHDPTYTLEEVGHSVGLCLNFRDSKYGRKAGSGCWDGAAKTQYWLDPVSGIAVSRNRTS